MCCFWTKTFSNWYWTLLFHIDKFCCQIIAASFFVIDLSWCFFLVLSWLQLSLCVLWNCLTTSFTEPCVLLRFAGKPIFFSFLGGLPKPAIEFKFVGPHFYKHAKQDTWLCWYIGLLLERNSKQNAAYNLTLWWPMICIYVMRYFVQPSMTYTYVMCKNCRPLLLELMA